MRGVGVLSKQVTITRNNGGVLKACCTDFAITHDRTESYTQGVRNE